LILFVDREFKEFKEFKEFRTLPDIL